MNKPSEGEIRRAMADEITALRARVAELEATERDRRDWQIANGPGGWIDRLRQEIERLRPLESQLQQVKADAERLPQAVMLLSSLVSLAEAEGWRNGAIPEAKELFAAFAARRNDGT